MADTPWSGGQADKLYLTSGQFTSTIKTSQSITAIDTDPMGITWDGTDTPWCGFQAAKLYLTSDQFTSTIKDSEAIGGIETYPMAISWDGTNTPWTGQSDDKLYLTSDQFTSTIKDSEYVGGVDATPRGITYDGTNTPWCGVEAYKLYLTSDQFTSTLKDSEYVGGVDITPEGISWDGTNTPWIGYEAKKLYLTSDQFTSTIKKSEYIGDIDTNPTDICTNDVNGRLGIGGNIYEESRSNTISFSQVVVEELVLPIDMFLSGHVNDKLWLFSGQFSTVIKDSESVSGYNLEVTGISYDGIDTLWSGAWSAGDKLYRQSGAFTSTLKDSENVNGIDTYPMDISSDHTNTPWIGDTNDKLYLTSGKFTSTIKTSESIGPTVRGISYDGTNTPWSDEHNLKLTSGQFSSTIKDSEAVNGIDNLGTGISWDGNNTPWTGAASDKMYLQSGQFTSTLKNSISVFSLDNAPTGISNFNYGTRVGTVYTDTPENTIIFIHTGTGIKVTSHSLESTLLFGQISASHTVGSLAYIYNNTVFNNIVFSHDIVSEKVFGLPASEACRLNIPRWIYASVSKYFSTIAANNGLHFFIEGTYRQTNDHQKYIEFRMDGPSFTQVSKNIYYIDIEINMLWSFNQDDEDFHETERLKGILIDAMRDICVYRYGDGMYDDDSLVNTLQLRQDTKTPISVNNFGQIRSDVRLMQGTVAGKYRMIHSC